LQKDLFDVVRHIGQSRQDKQQKVSDFLASLASTLEETTDILRQAQYPAASAMNCFCIPKRQLRSL